MIYNGNNKLIKNEFIKMLLDEDITQVEIAKRLGISNNQLSNTFNKVNLSFTDIYKMLNAAGYDLEINFKKKSTNN